ncbi:ABC transporter permease [Cereibacter changlensis]|uniref:ABC transporter permease n=1 Tax=Cereibacter changlensis TaxID=402884 RepID=UPI001FEB71E5|nr:ABC transporter permease [Cereibacter changlensis]
MRLISLLHVVVAVCFLSRLTGDPAALYLPVEASDEMRQHFREVHGLNDPVLVQFGRYVADLVQLDFGESIRKVRPAFDVVIEAFWWTLQLALITMGLVTAAAIGLGSLAAFRAGGLFDRIATVTSLIGASAPDFWVGIVVLSAGSAGCLPRALARRPTGSCRSLFSSSAPSD